MNSKIIDPKKKFIRLQKKAKTSKIIKAVDIAKTGAKNAGKVASLSRSLVKQDMARSAGLAVDGLKESGLHHIVAPLAQLLEKDIERPTSISLFKPASSKQKER